MEATITVYIRAILGVYIGILENKMETTITVFIRFMLGLYRDNRNKTETTLMGYIWAIRTRCYLEPVGFGI